MTDLNFLNLSERHFGLTKAVADGYAEAACVCLDRHHSAPVSFRLRDRGSESIVDANWQSTDQRTKDAWNNAIDTTEAGAYALALAAVENSRGMVAVMRAETRTGADYYIDLPGSPTGDLEKSLRLEVSGVDAGTDAIVSSRLRQKQNQAMAGDSNLPAVACVVGFSNLQIMIADAAET